MEPNPEPNPDPTPEHVPAGTPESDELVTARAELEAARAETDATRAALAQAQQQATELDQARADAAARAEAAQQTALSAHRRAVLAENAGQVIPELVQGSSAEEIDASIEAAKAAYTRIAESVRASAQAELSHSLLPAVPPGASPRGEPPAEDLSPLQKITSALARNGR